MKRFASLYCVLFFGYMLTRAEFLIWNWQLFQNQGFGDVFLAFLVGARFDLASISLSLAPFWFLLLMPQRVWKNRFFEMSIFIGFVSLQFFLFLLNMLDVEMVHFSGRRWTWDSLFLFQEAVGKMGGFFKTYGILFAVNFALLSLFFWYSYKIFFSETNVEKKQIGLKLRIGQLFLSFVFILITARGGWQYKPIHFTHSQVFVAPLLNQLVLNSTFTLIKSVGRSDLEKVKFFAGPDEYKPYLNFYSVAQDRHNSQNWKNRSPAKAVVLIILESFSAEYTGLNSGATSFTPFLDQIMKKGLSFPRAYANGKRSIEGIAAIFAGIPAMMNEPFVTSTFATNYFVGLGTHLSRQGYQNTFFHGGANGTMYFDSFMKTVGVDNYVGLNEYPNSADYDGVWGVYDGPFFKYFAKKLKEQMGLKRPVLMSLFSLSSHHPYSVPESLKGQFPQGPLPIINSIAYTDWCLQQLFAEIQNESWFKDVLFVVTADHTSKSYTREFSKAPEDSRIPLIFYREGQVWPNVDLKEPVQQIDILPSILHYQGIETDSTVRLAKSVFSPGPRKVLQYLQPNYAIVKKEGYLIWNKERILETSFAEDVEAEKSLNELKAGIQYFSSSLWDNRLY